MKKISSFSFLLILIAFAGFSDQVAQAKGDDFGDVVKAIERFYQVKHKGLPFLAKAGIKATTTVARLAGGPKRQLAEAGSVKVAYFEDQEFDSRGRMMNFKASISAVLAEGWSPLVQVACPTTSSKPMSICAARERSLTYW